MSTTGELVQAEDTYEGFIADLAFDADIRLVPNPRKSEEKHPDFIVNGKSPRGREIEVGAAWKKISQADAEYLSLSINIGGKKMNVNAVPAKKGDMAELRIIPYAN